MSAFSANFQWAFGFLVLAQSLHSVEEYVGRLWESFPPARYLTGLISSDRELGFLVLNVALAGFGAWCVAGPARTGSPAARGLAWFWVVLETVNGVGHSLWTLLESAYTPGVATAPLLLALAWNLARQLRGGVATASDRLEATPTRPAGGPPR